MYVQGQIQKIQTNIPDEIMADHIDKIVEARHADEVKNTGLVGALESAIKEIHGNVAYIYGRFGDMPAIRVLQNIIDNITETVAADAPEVKS